MSITIDKIIKSSRKSIVINISNDAKVIVKAPTYTSDQDILIWVNTKQKWIERKKKLIQTNQANNPPKKYQNGETFLYMGKQFPLQISDKGPKKLKFRNQEFHLHTDKQDKAKDQFTKWYKEMAKEIITDRTDYLANKYNFTYKSLRITSARSRWGSCSSKKTLCFSWRLIMAPLDTTDYVILHELAHLKHMNHSKAFWTLVESMMPNYKIHKKWLKDNGISLDL